MEFRSRTSVPLMIVPLLLLLLVSCSKTVLDQDPSKDVASEGSIFTKVSSSSLLVAEISGKGKADLLIPNSTVVSLFKGNSKDHLPSELLFTKGKEKFTVKKYNSKKFPQNRGYFLTGFAYDKKLEKNVWLRLKLDQDGNQLLAKRKRQMLMRVSFCACEDQNVKLVFDQKEVEGEIEERPRCYELGADNQKIGGSQDCLVNRHHGYHMANNTSSEQ